MNDIYKINDAWLKNAKVTKNNMKKCMKNRRK